MKEDEIEDDAGLAAGTADAGSPPTADDDRGQGDAYDGGTPDDDAEATEAGNGYRPHDDDDKTDDRVHHLGGMYQSWFLDYASYVILERAVPHLLDGLKPVQRRLLHAMKEIDDRRFSKVANIVGQTMQFHPHGDASIGDALVQMGQKDLMIDTQGNWGNILTGDGAAAPRYIEARLSPFALEVAYNNKITPWQLSYDGRKKEPINLPMKFPLLLAQGVEGIAVGLSSKILPHNFNELLDASVKYLRGEEFELYPDFPTGGLVDVSKYHDGARGGSVRVRSRIEKVDQKTLRIVDVPFGKTVGTVIDSIKKAIDKGKIKIRKFDDFTAQKAEILVHLMPGVSGDKTIDALYAFTDCEVSISPNCCVIYDRKPHFLTVSEVLRRSADHTRELLRQELEVQRAELMERLMVCSLEKIFIEERIYKDREYEQAKSVDIALDHIGVRLERYFAEQGAEPIRPVTRDDLQHLLEIKMGRIIRFNSDKAEEEIAAIKKRIKEVNAKLRHLTEYTIEWFEHLREKYGKGRPRLTEIRNFNNVDATKVIESNLKLYVNRDEGFIGTDLKKDEFVCNCSEIDDILVIFKSGQYKIVKAEPKTFVGTDSDIVHIAVWRKSDARTIYNLVYRDGKRGGPYYIKRCNITSVQRDKAYDLTMGTEGSRLEHLTVNPNGEAEVIHVGIKTRNKVPKTAAFDKDFAEVPIRGRGSRGLLLTRADLQRISVKERGGSTLGGRPVWWDADVQRINYDRQGTYLGEFQGEDRILVVLKNYDYYITNFDENNHYEPDVIRIEKYDPQKVWTMVMKDWETDLHNLKRSTLEARPTRQNMLGDAKRFSMVLLTDTPFPRLGFTFGKGDAFRPMLEVEADEFIVVRSVQTKGKKVSNYYVERVEELEPTKLPEPAEAADDDAEDAASDDLGEAGADDPGDIVLSGE